MSSLEDKVRQSFEIAKCITNINKNSERNQVSHLFILITHFSVASKRSKEEDPTYGLFFTEQ